MKEKTFQVLRRGFAVWLIIIAAEFVHGTLRILLLEPVVGDFRARQLTVFSGILIILAITRLFIGWMRPLTRARQIYVGLMWTILTVAFEISLGRILNLSWERIFSDYNLANGGLMGFGLLFLFFAPLIAAKLPPRKILNTVH